MRHAVVGLLLWAVAGLAAAQSGEKLGVGDAVRVTVFQQPDLTLETRVDEKGAILMPLIGQVKLAGLTTTAASTQIADALKQGGETVYVDRAPVFYIYGEVTRSGSYRLEPNLAVVQAISLGGGITPRGTERGLTIQRKGPDGSLQRIEARPSDLVRADDIIYVKESLF